ncbi:MAG: FHA domain-containing protein [Planctomycetota bacterium]
MSDPEPLIEVMGPPVEPAAAEVREGVVWRLRVRPVTGEEREIVLGEQTVSIGRADANEVHLDDAQLSRFHARLAIEDGAWVLTDLSSKNGTSVNGRAVDRHVLQHGDLIQIGESVLVFEREASVEVPSEILAPPPAPTVGDEHLDMMLSFAEMLSCAEEELGVLDDVVSRARDVVRSDRAVLYLVEEGQSKPLMQYMSEDTVTGEESLTGEPMIELAMQVEEPSIETVPGPLPRHLLVVPLHSRYRKLGVLVIERRSAFLEAELRLASIAGAHITSFLRGVI